MGRQYVENFIHFRTKEKPAQKGSKQRIAPHKSTNIHIFQDQKPYTNYILHAFQNQEPPNSLCGV